MFAVQPGTVYLVGAGPGDPGLITLRGLACLAQAQVVIHDRLIDRWLLGLAAGAEMINVGKQPDHHPVSQTKINALLVEKARQGVVVRLKGGDPFVFGRGGEEALALAQAGIPFEIVPGVTSAVAVPAYAGIPVTQRGVAGSVAFITGHRADSDEQQSKPPTSPPVQWQHLAQGVDTLVFLMGVQNLAEVVNQLIANGRSPDTPAALIQQGTSAAQKTVTGTLANLVDLARQIHSPAITVVGEVVRLQPQLDWFEQQFKRHRPLWGLRVLTTRSVVAGAHEFPVQRFFTSLLPGVFSPDPLDALYPLHTRLAALGAEPLSLPTTQVAPASDMTALDIVFKNLTQMAGRRLYDWICFTSPYSVVFFCERLFELGYDARLLNGIRLAVLGNAPALALRAFGLVADVQSSGASSNLARKIKAQIDASSGESPKKTRVLVPCSDLADPAITGELRFLGAEVDTVMAYSNQPVALETGRKSPSFRMLMDGEVDVVTFLSPSAVNGMRQLFDSVQDMQQALAKTLVACIGQGTAEAARQLGVTVGLVPEIHQSGKLEDPGEARLSLTSEALVEALVKWRSER
jgi:uroporphyrinogen III methyltransferase/synthase